MGWHVIQMEAVQPATSPSSAHQALIQIDKSIAVPQHNDPEYSRELRTQTPRRVQHQLFPHIPGSAAARIVMLPAVPGVNDHSAKTPRAAPVAQFTPGQTAASGRAGTRDEKKSSKEKKEGFHDEELCL